LRAGVISASALTSVLDLGEGERDVVMYTAGGFKHTTLGLGDVCGSGVCIGA